jgi:hypothetical protein
LQIKRPTKSIKRVKKISARTRTFFIVSNIKSVDHCVLSIDQDKTVCKTIEKIASDFGATYDLSFANGGPK